MRKFIAVPLPLTQPLFTRFWTTLFPNVLRKYLPVKEVQSLTPVTLNFDPVNLALYHVCHLTCWIKFKLRTNSSCRLHMEHNKLVISTHAFSSYIIFSLNVKKLMWMYGWQYIYWCYLWCFPGSTIVGTSDKHSQILAQPPNPHATMNLLPMQIVWYHNNPSYQVRCTKCVS